MKMHDVPSGLFVRKKLCDRALTLRAMDCAILREGGVHKLSTEQLRSACHLRGKLILVSGLVS